MLVRTKLLRRTNLKTKEGAVKDTQKNSGNVNVDDENKASHHSMTTFDNVGTTLNEDQRKAKEEKVWYKKETRPQYVQNKQSNSSIKTTGNSLTDKENTLTTKQGGFNFGQQDDLLLQEVAQNRSSSVLELSGVQKHKIDIFAAEHVGKICETALSKVVMEKSQEVAKDFVTNVVSLAKHRINLQSQDEDVSSQSRDNMEKNDGYQESPSFSKVWKYSQLFAADHAHEIPESLRLENSRLNGSKFDTCSKLRSKGDAQVKNNSQCDEMGNEVVESPTSSNCSLTANSSNSSSQSLELHKPNTNSDSLPTYVLDNELDTHSELKKATNNSQPLQGVSSEFEHSHDEQVLANDQLDTKAKFDESAYSLEGGGVTSVSCHTCAKEVPVEGNEDSRKTESEKSIDIGIVTSVNDLDETNYEKDSESENNTCSQTDESGFCNELNSEENERAKKEDEHASPSIFVGDFSSNAATKETNNLPAKKHDNCGRNESIYRRKPLYKRTVSESQASERRQWCATEPGGEDLQATFHGFHSSCRPDSTASKFVRSTSCPVVSEVSRNLCSSLVNAWNHSMNLR